MRTNLMRARKDHSMTQEQFAHKLGMTTRYYQKLENGVVNGSLEMWFRLKEELDMSLDDLTFNNTTNTDKNQTV